ncbi:MAG: hypothetical protein KatS3mg129_2088 [Leptospiraceae bacterium]|nr:MAG: hypothetical protein KatS3mg129_2088 [Leptospiraceae bacterium]
MTHFIKNNELPHYTYKDYVQWEGDWELIDGVAFSMAPSPFGKHQKILKNIIFILELQIKQNHLNYYVYPELDWIVNEDTIIRPDISITNEEIEEFIRKPPVMIIEIISKNTKQKDETIKYRLYEEQKVDYYMLVYPEKKEVKLYKHKGNQFEPFPIEKDFIVLEFQENIELKLPTKEIFV